MRLVFAISSPNKSPTAAVNDGDLQQSAKQQSYRCTSRDGIKMSKSQESSFKSKRGSRNTPFCSEIHSVWISRQLLSVSPYQISGIGFKHTFFLECDSKSAHDVRFFVDFNSEFRLKSSNQANNIASWFHPYVLWTVRLCEADCFVWFKERLQSCFTLDCKFQCFLPAAEWRCGRRPCFLSVLSRADSSLHCTHRFVIFLNENFLPIFIFKKKLNKVECAWHPLTRPECNL